MSDRQGQATVEWVALLMVSALLATGILVGLHGLSTRLADVTTSLEGMASAGAVAATAPRPPLLAMTRLPVVSGGSIVAIASQLAAAGIAESPSGSNRGPGVDAFTDGNAEPWCADFVSWVLRAAGRPFSGGLSAGWRLAWTGDVRAWFVARDAFRERLVADPQPGDVVWFAHGHVGIVEAVHGDALATIEGNSGNAVTRRTYSHWRIDADIGGFGRSGVSASGG
ncbi:MAG: CHAP domain-containing protein [Gaiellales bacterium]